MGEWGGEGRGGRGRVVGESGTRSCVGEWGGERKGESGTRSYVGEWGGEGGGGIKDEWGEERV